MTLDELIKVSNSYTDEVLSGAEAIRFANEGLSLINSKFSINLSFFEDITTEYVGLSDTWLRRLLVPYLNYSVKMKESSLNEAAEYKNTFYEAISDFNNVYLEILDEEYLGEAVGAYEMDTVDAVNMGWFSRRGSGGL